MQHIIEMGDVQLGKKMQTVVQQLAKQRSIATNSGENALSYFFTRYSNWKLAAVLPNQRLTFVSTCLVSFHVRKNYIVQKSLVDQLQSITLLIPKKSVV